MLRGNDKKRLLVVIVVFALCGAMMGVRQLNAATVIIHDEPGTAEQIRKAKEQCTEDVNAADGTLGGSVSARPSGDVWLLDPTGYVTVTSSSDCNVIYIQYRSSDDNDGVSDIYVDDMNNPLVRIDTYMRGTWYVEIRDLPNTSHTVKVHASGNSDMTGVIVSPEHGSASLGDNDVWYFCFGDGALTAADLTITRTSGGNTDPYPARYRYICGSAVEVTAIPQTCYELDHWELDGNDVGPNNPYSVTMDSNHTLHAVFTQVGTYDLTITATGGGTTDPNAGTHTYACEAIVEVNALPDECNEFDYWELDGNNVGPNNPYSVTMDSNHTLHAVFTQVGTYDLTITATGGGTTDPNPGTYGYICGSGVEANAIPETCYEFDHWELDGDSVGSDNPYAVVMDSNHALYAFFTCKASIRSPADEAEDVATEVVLSWLPACCANSHEVYFGTSFAEVNDANTSDLTGIYRGPQDVNSYDTNDYDANGLDLDTTYYWRIDEVNDAHSNSPWKGDVWRFTVGHIVVEDFESYAGDASLWAVWDDYWTNSSGAEVYLETDVNFTRDGNSLRYVYDSGYQKGPTCYGSIADTDTARLGIGSDWTSSGARALVLYFYGDPCNSATADDQLWVQLEDTNSNSGLALYDDVNDLALPSWAEWNIDLDIFDACGVSLANVDKISIGFAGETVGGDCKGGGIGTVWFDDIRLYPPRCVPEYGPEADLTGDCGVDFKDFGVVGEDWLKCNKLPDPNGFVEEWVARYDGPGNSDDGATAIAVDDSNNVYVTGYSIGDGTGGDYATIRYGPDSNETIWVARYNGPTNDGDVASAIAVDDSNNVYVTGQSDGGATGYDYATIKYDPADGNELWSARYNGPGNGSDEGWDIAVDDSNNVYVTGGSYGDGTGDDYATIKYDPVDGNELWVARYNGPGNGGDVALAIAVDDSNNVYVTGRSWGNGTDHDYATIKYDPADGNELWVARYNGPGNSSDEGWDIAVDDSGFVYVTGRSNGTGDDYATIKYDPADGNELWVARYNGPGNGQDEAQAIAVDDSNNVYVTGGSYGSGTDHDYATIKYDLADGNELWVARYNGPGNDIDVAHAIAVDDSNNVYVTGVSYGDSTDEDYATIKYDPNGNQLWLDRYNGPVNGIDYATGIAIDDMGNVYVTGESGYMSPESHYATIKYSQVSCTPPLDGDLNNDCKVDFQDLAIVVDNWLEEFLWPEP